VQPPPSPLNVAAILQAVYRQPPRGGQELAERVRARLALLETVAECFRLLVEAPVSAISNTVSAGERGERARS
jgi:hypothetical protein